MGPIMPLRKLPWRAAITLVQHGMTSMTQCTRCSARASTHQRFDVHVPSWQILQQARLGLCLPQKPDMLRQALTLKAAHVQRQAWVSVCWGHHCTNSRWLETERSRQNSLVHSRAARRIPGSVLFTNRAPVDAHAPQIPDHTAGTQSVHSMTGCTLESKPGHQAAVGRL